MIKQVFSILIGVLFAATVNAQIPQTDSEAKAAISKLAFMTGQWEGEGWMMTPDGQKHPFSQTEDIAFKLDSTAILIEGHGKTGNTVVHDALAVLTYNKDDKSYTLRSYLANGQQGDFKAELDNEKLTWYPTESMRYVILLNEKGQWQEKGEFNRGNDWFQFFEMTLDRK